MTEFPIEPTCRRTCAWTASGPRTADHRSALGSLAQIFVNGQAKKWRIDSRRFMMGESKVGWSIGPAATGRERVADRLTTAGAFESQP
jgi:hypothetical protein